MIEFFSSPYVVMLSVIILLVILITLAFSLYSLYLYFVKRLPRDINAHDRFIEFEEKARLAELKHKAILDACEKTKEELINFVKEEQAYGIDKSLIEQANKDLAKVNAQLQEAKEEYFDIVKNRLKDDAEYHNIEDKKRKLEEDYNKINALLSEIKNNHPELDDLKRNKEELDKTLKEIDRRKLTLDIVSEKLETTQKKYQDIEQIYENKKADLEKELNNTKDLIENDIREKKSQLEPIESELNEKKYALGKADREIAIQRHELSFLKEKCNELSSYIENEKGKELGYDSLKEIPSGLKALRYKQTLSSNENENDLLEKFAEFLKGNGYFFSKEVINAFHTSLKIQDINPLTVLAGISGTGKTLLPTQYSEFFGFYQLLMPVQPRWDSPQDLIGFYNYLEKKYQSTELAQALVCFDGTKLDEKNDFIKDRMMMVLLDEMNLARTEYYFSEFLSRLELRRIVNKDDKEERKKAEILIDHKFGSVIVPDNVLFVGTMNEDESTQTLSDKVLDRANLLRFGKPEEFKNTYSSTSSVKLSGIMTKSLWDAWCKKNNDAPHNDRVQKYISDLNEAMSLIGKPFGHRVHDAISSYVANYPNVQNEENLNQALSDQIEQKIMPKLRGCDLSLENTLRCIDKIKNIIDDLKNEKLSSAFNHASDNTEHEMFIWQGISR